MTQARPVEVQQPGARRFHLQLAHLGRAARDLALEVGLVYAVVVHQIQRADAGRGQVERHNCDFQERVTPPTRQAPNHAPGGLVADKCKLRYL